MLLFERMYLCYMFFLIFKLFFFILFDENIVVSNINMMVWIILNFILNIVCVIGFVIIVVGFDIVYISVSIVVLDVMLLNSCIVMEINGVKLFNIFKGIMIGENYYIGFIKVLKCLSFFDFNLIDCIVIIFIIVNVNVIVVYFVGVFNKNSLDMLDKNIKIVRFSIIGVSIF